jgi:molybdate transport system permease protein
MEAAAIPLLLTLKVAATATVLAVLAGVLAGLIIARARFPGRDAVDAVLLLPMVLPPTVLGYYLLVMLGMHGPLGAWLDRMFGIRLLFTWQGAAIAAAVVAFPLVFKAARTAFESIEPDVEKAGRSLGYPEWAVLLRITVPLAWRGIVAGAMLAFARAMGEFGATLMVAGNIPGRTQTLSIAIYEAVQAGDDALANGLVALASVTCIVLLVAAASVVRRGHLNIVPV